MAVIGSDVQNLVIENIFLTEGVHRFSTMIHLDGSVGILFSTEYDRTSLFKEDQHKSYQKSSN